MASRRVSTAAGAICVAAIFFTVPGGVANATELIVGTGSKTGVYFQVGRAICRIVDRIIKDTGCRPIESE
tara:strand:- start:518 stop:727 length:210 start_codon:yes stop_codon:yes gene_type:complete